jgi:hypothetical protein
MTRTDVFGLLRNAPARTVARKLGCTTEWLVDVCEIEKVPVLSAEYWRKRRAGVRTNGRSLAQPFLKPMLEVSDDGCRHLALDDAPYLRPPIPPLPKDVADGVAQQAPAAVVAPAADHPVVAAARREAKQRQRTHEVPLLAWSVSAPLVDRVFLILNRLFDALERNKAEISRNACPEPGPKEWRPDWGQAGKSQTLITLLGQSFRVSIVEKHRLAASANALPSWHPNYEAPRSEPTGVLHLELRSSDGGWLRTWRDTGIKTIESRIDRVVRDMLLLVAERRSRQEAEVRRRGNEEAAKEALRQSTMARERSNQRTALLRKMAQDWAAAEQLRGFVAAFAATAARSNDTESAAAWTQWANELVQSIDPLSSGCEKVLAAYRSVDEAVERMSR